MIPTELPKPTLSTHDTPSGGVDTGGFATAVKPGKLLRLPAVEERTGLKKSTVYAGVSAKTFPAPVRLSARAVAWREEEIDRWISERTSKGQ